MKNTVVVHFPGGRMLKGFTNNFLPNKDKFHLTDEHTGEVREVPLTGLKAVFFVKDFEGDRTYRERMDLERVGFGKKMQVDFKDGETLIGYSHGFSPDRAGFFLFPADPDSNNDRIYIFTAATKAARFL